MWLYRGMRVRSLNCQRAALARTRGPDIQAIVGGSFDVHSVTCSGQRCRFKGSKAGKGQTDLFAERGLGHHHAEQPGRVVVREMHRGRADVEQPERPDQVTCCVRRPARPPTTLRRDGDDHAGRVNVQCEEHRPEPELVEPAIFAAAATRRDLR